MALQLKQFSIPDIPPFDVYDGNSITKNLPLNIDIPTKYIKSLKLTMKINLIDNVPNGSIEFQFGNTNIEGLNIQTTGNVIKDYTKNVELTDIQVNYPVKVIGRNLKFGIVAVSITDIVGEVTFEETKPQINSSINIGRVEVNNIFLGAKEINKVYIGSSLILERV